MDSDETPHMYENAIIVLGGSNQRFMKRLEKGIELQDKNKKSLLIITGQDIHSDRGIEKMLEQNTDFIHENASKNTQDNAENAYLMLKIVRGNYRASPFYESEFYGSDIRKVYLVTDTLHMVRAKRYFRKEFKNEFELSFQTVPEDKDTFPKKLVYESAGYIVSFLPKKYINFAKAAKNRYFGWL